MWQSRRQLAKKFGNRPKKKDLNRPPFTFDWLSIRAYFVFCVSLLLDLKTTVLITVSLSTNVATGQRQTVYPSKGSIDSSQREYTSQGPKGPLCSTSCVQRRVGWTSCSVLSLSRDRVDELNTNQRYSGGLEHAPHAFTF